MTLLQVRDLNVSFRTGDGTVNAVNGVDLRVAAGQAIAVVGESGSGKSSDHARHHGSPGAKRSGVGLDHV